MITRIKNMIININNNSIHFYCYHCNGNDKEIYEDYHYSHYCYHYTIYDYRFKKSTETKYFYKFNR